MQVDTDKIDDMALALLHLTSFKHHNIVRAWKGHDWGELSWLYEKGFIGDPRSKAKSVELSDDGAKRSMDLFKIFFEKKV